MDTTPRKRSVARWFLRTYLGRIIIALILIVVVQLTSFWLLFVLPYQREQRIAKKIEALGGYVGFSEMPSDWIPAFVCDRLPIWERILVVDLKQTEITDAGLEQLKGLMRLESLHLNETEVTDAGLEQIKELKSLESLDLRQTQVTDTGLKHLKAMSRLEELDLDQTHVTDNGLENLKGLKSLTYLYLHNSQTTEEGRAMLRKALPNCQITPNP